MTFRPGPLRAAAALAAGFVVVRVFYRVLFHGADGTGTVLLDLPSWRLPRPFAHVVVLGPVTTDGLTDAVASALPIALTILAFGLLNALVDLPRLFVRGARRGPLSGLARALAIAWATLPSLADAARAVRFAQRLRGERGGVRMLAPLLQRTLERAGGVASALELRGFAGRGLGGDCRAPVEARGLDLGFGARTPGAAAGGGIRVGSLVLETGTLTLVSGPTGSGKSTLLRAIAGLHTHGDGGWLSGSLRVAGHDRGAVAPRDLARVVGVVLQHPREAFATERVRDEIGLALELRGVARVIAAARVAEVASRMGIAGLQERPTRGLSAGEATLVAIAAAVIEEPILLVVDEPLADLDADARGRVASLLDALAHDAGMCVVVAEHRIEALEAFADRRLHLDAPGVRAEASPGSALSPAVRSPVERVSTGSTGSTGSTTMSGTCLDTGAAAVLRADSLTVRHRDLVAVASAALELRAGEFVALVGPNGAGKSSLLAALAMPGRGARVEAPGRVALVPDASDDLFVHDTVAAECARADKRARRVLRDEARSRDEASTAPSAPHLGASPHLGTGSDRRRRPSVVPGPVDAGCSAARFAGFLGLDAGSPEFAARLSRHPRDLSVGERRCLALALQLASAPAVLMVDEPTRGLDPAARDMVVAALRSLAASGAAVLVASHEPDLAADADRVLTMRAGILTPAAASPTAPPAPAGASLAFRTPDDFTRPIPEPRNSGAPARPHAGSPEFGTPAGVLGTGPGPGASGREPVRGAETTASVRARQVEPVDGPGSASGPEARMGRPGRGGVRIRRPRVPIARVALAAANLVALGAFCWPLLATAVPEQAEAAVPIAALALAPLAALVAIATLDGTVRSAHMLALLGTLAAIGAAVRVASTGVGGVEAVFILLILAGRAFGPRFALILGMATIAMSSVLWGAIGPWTPFQMFACAWVGAVAGLLPRVRSPRGEIAMLCVYGVVASYVFGLLMNLWFWPFAVGYGTGISYDGSAPLGTNLSSFLLYSLVTSTLSWDTLRAITTVVGLVVVGRAVLSALRRAKPLRASASVRPRSTSPRGGGRRTRPSTAPGAAAALR